jgi:serine/threonine protein kinase/Tol biopolymer transport system component
VLSAGTMLGPYKIVAPIGAGGMGEVYRAQDTRLERDVAVKVLSRTLVNDAEALRRFEQEARAAGMLNHPNILAIYDIGVEGEQRYIVSELLEGQSLRARVREGPIPARRALDYGAQLARGMAAAHERGIIHRDLKPENVFVTRDGHVKILDFGLVKLAGQRVPAAQQNSDTEPTLVPGHTEPGRIMGTVGYMAPEQIRGLPGDSLSDIFAFGAILYEMLAGRPAFRGESPIETLNAILRDDPLDFFELNLRIPAALDRIVRHCLEKKPEDRFQSARDLAFDLGSLSGLTSKMVYAGPRWRINARALAIPLLVVVAALATLGGGYLLGQRNGRIPPPSFHRLTYRGGTIYNARFSSDGQTVFYGGRWGSNPMAVFSARPDSPESRGLEFGVADVLGVSRSGLLAISLNRRPIGYVRNSGTLAQVPIAGGAPRKILDDVEEADWSPDGRLAIVRTVTGRNRLEFPIGRVLYQTVGWISSPRFSPRGDAIAFVDHPFLNDDRGTVSIVTTADATRRTLTSEAQSVQGLAWRPNGDEVWFTAERDGTARALRTVTLRGKERVIATSAGALSLHDIAADGRALVSRDLVRAGIVGVDKGGANPRDLSWLDYSVVRDLSADGRTIVFSESGEAGGALYGVYLRHTDGDSAVRLGDGTTEALSPDGNWVLSIPRNRKEAQIVMLPTGTGQAHAITHDAINHRSARWFPDGRRILFHGNEPGRPPRLWVQSIDGGGLRAVSPENVVGTQVTPDNRYILGRAGDRKYYLYPVAGGAPVPVPALHGDDVPVRFTPDGRAVFVGTFGKIPALLTKVDLASGARVPWLDAMPAEPSGLTNVGPIFVTPDGGRSVYSYTRLLSDLYLVEVKK